jgi:hypothetical protein
MYPSWLVDHQQLDLFKNKLSGMYLTKHNSRVVVGQFFEHLTSKLINDSVLADVYEGVANPDLIVWNGKLPFDILLEVKASMKAHLFDIHQIKYYSALQDNNFPYTRPKMYYVLWCYHFNKESISMAGSALNLVKRLGNYIDACFIIPIEIVHLIIKYLPVMSYGKWSTDIRQYYYRIPRKVFDFLKAGNLRSMTNAILAISNEDIGSKYTVTEYPIDKIHLGYSIIKPFSLFTISNMNWDTLIKRS